jgi:hypothetical protein
VGIKREGGGGAEGGGAREVERARWSAGGGAREVERARWSEGGNRDNRFDLEQRSQRSQRIATSTAHGSPSGPPGAGRIAAGVLIVGTIRIDKWPGNMGRPLVDPDRTNDHTARSALRRTRPASPRRDLTRAVVCQHSFPFTPLAPLLRFSRSVVSLASVNSPSTTSKSSPSQPQETPCYKSRIGVIKLACQGPMRC